MGSLPVQDSLSAGLDELLRKTVERGRHVRHGLAVVAEVDGTWEWRGAVGVADRHGKPATTDSRYPIASVTKLYTAAVTMRLVEHGRLTLGTLLVDVLPSEVTRRIHVYKGVDHTSEITVEHLLRHTSGLPDYYGEAPSGKKSAQRRLLSGEDAPMPFAEVIRLVRDELNPHFAPQLPGTARKAFYSDTNFQLLGAIVEEVSRQSLRDVFSQELFVPLGLSNTSSYPDPPGSGDSPLPDTDVWSKDTVLNPDGALRHQTPDGGIISALDDQVSFMRALVGGRVFDEPETWPGMYRSTSRIFFPIEYGLGVMRYAPPRWMSPMFAVPPIVGHTGSTASWLFHCPDLDLILAGTFDVARPPLPFRFLPRVLQLASSVLA